jgi:hypothetical protein
MEFEYVSYRRSNRKVIKTSDGMVYSNSSKGRPGQPNIRYVRCVLKECPGTGKIKTDTAEFDPTRLHNHLPDKYDLATKQMEVRLRKTASTSQHMTLKQIFDEETRIDGNGAAVSFAYLESGMLKSRRKNLPRAPQSIQELTASLREDGFFGVNFKAEARHGDEVALVFISEAAAGKLPTTYEVHFDGTFYVCPQMFYQLWTILGSCEGTLFPLVHILMSGKRKGLYLAALWELANLYPTFQPTFAMGDFEIAARAAWKEIYPKFK